MTSLPLAAIDLLRVVDPERTAQVEQLKKVFDERLAAIEAEAETRAADAGAAISQQQSAAIEQQLCADGAAATAAAEAELASLVAGGADDYRRSFAQARELLGSDWPLVGSAAIPVAPVAAEGAAS